MVKKKQSCYLQLGTLFARFSRPMDHETSVTRNVLCDGGRLVVLLSIRTFWSVRKNLFGSLLTEMYQGQISLKIVAL